jgi:hypothetical protein
MEGRGTLCPVSTISYRHTNNCRPLSRELLLLQGLQHVTIPLFGWTQKLAAPPTVGYGLRIIVIGANRPVGTVFVNPRDMQPCEDYEESRSLHVMPCGSCKNRRFGTTRNHIRENHILRSHRRGDQKSYIALTGWAL